MQVTAAQIGAILEGEIVGDPNTLVLRPGKIEDAQVGEITFLANPKYEPFVYTTNASVVLVSREFEPKKPLKPTMIRVDNVYEAIAFLLEKFGNHVAAIDGISSKAEIDSTAILGEDVSAAAFTVVESQAEIGDHTQLGAQVFVGHHAKIGKHCIIYSGAKIHHNCVIGDYCIIHSNVVIGSDGFGFVPQEDGTYKKIAQTGNVIVENHVEIGANSTIDRATMGSTIIREGAKLDNLVMVAHNTEIGSHTVVAAQAGFAGSSKIGANCMIGGQAGFVGHIKVADGTKVQAQSGVNKSIEKENTALYGSPVLPYNDYLRSYAMFRKLPQMMRRIQELEKQLKDKNS